MSRQDWVLQHMQPPAQLADYWRRTGDAAVMSWIQRASVDGGRCVEPVAG